jgi:hypothetical protein
LPVMVDAHPGPLFENCITDAKGASTPKSASGRF